MAGFEEVYHLSQTRISGVPDGSAHLCLLPATLLTEG